MSFQMTPSKPTLPPTNIALLTVSQADPVSGTKYTVLDTTDNVRVIALAVQVIWTVQPDPLEIHLTIDGTLVSPFFNNPVTATYYGPIISIDGDFSLNVNNYILYKPFIFEARRIKIEMETTGGTVSAITAKLRYAKW